MGIVLAAELLGSVGSEIGRMRRWRDRDECLVTGVLECLLELLDLALADRRWSRRSGEIAHPRELLCDAAPGGREYATTLDDRYRYVLGLAVAERRGCHSVRGRANDRDHDVPGRGL